MDDRVLAGTVSPYAVKAWRSNSQPHETFYHKLNCGLLE